jgi:hypothetical protein
MNYKNRSGTFDQAPMKSRGWFYESIYHTLLADRIDLEMAIKPARPSGRRSQVENM